MDGGGSTRATFASQFQRYEEGLTWAVEGGYLVTRNGKVQEAYDMGWLFSHALSQGIRAALSLPIDLYIFKLVINDDLAPVVEDLLARWPQLSPKNFEQLHDDNLCYEIDPEMGGWGSGGTFSRRQQPEGGAGGLSAISEDGHK